MKETLKSRTLKFMKKHKGITSLQAFVELGNTRLSSTIYSLRKDGYIIESKDIKVKTRWGNTTTVSKYILKGVKD